MILEFEELKTALDATGIPFAENGWDPKPDGDYGVYAIDFEGESLIGDDRKTDRCYEGSVDIYFYRLADKERYVEAIEDALTEICESGWQMNNDTHESGSGLFHIEWTFTVFGG